MNTTDFFLTNINYIGLFLEPKFKEKSLSIIKDILRKDHPELKPEKWYFDHVTLWYNNDSNEDMDIRNRLLRYIREGIIDIPFNITEFGISDRAAAFKVDSVNMDLICANKIPHITVCTFKGGNPVDSNFITDWREKMARLIIVGKLKIVYKDDRT